MPREVIQDMPAAPPQPASKPALSQKPVPTRKDFEQLRDRLREQNERNRIDGGAKQERKP